MTLDQIEAKADEAINALAATDKKDAALQFNSRLAERKYDNIVDAIFLVIEGSVEQRKAKARTVERSEVAYMEYLAAKRSFDELHNERETHKLRFEYCRSVMANRRQG
jgi:hypothetical protein